MQASSPRILNSTASPSHWDASSSCGSGRVDPQKLFVPNGSCGYSYALGFWRLIQAAVTSILEKNEQAAAVDNKLFSSSSLNPCCFDSDQQEKALESLIATWVTVVISYHRTLATQITRVPTLATNDPFQMQQEECHFTAQICGVLTEGYCEYPKPWTSGFHQNGHLMGG